MRSFCRWIVLLMVCMLGSCSRQDPLPAEPFLQDGVWTGTGEGRSGTILVDISNKTGLPSAAFSATMLRYTAFQQSGMDEDFGRSAAQMTSPLQTPPFYAIRVKPAIHHTMGGISVDADMHVLRADETPVPGLFAAGEVTGGVHGANRLGGNGVADIVVNGKIAGHNAAEYAK